MQAAHLNIYLDTQHTTTGLHKLCAILAGLSNQTEFVILPFSL